MNEAKKINIRNKDLHGRRAARLSVVERIKAQSVENPQTGCLEMTKALTTDGYAQVRVQGKLVAVHRLVMALAGFDIKGKVVRHLVCNNPRCINVAHLAVGTQADNVQDMLRQGRGASQRGTQVRGSKSHAAKLTEADIPEVFRLRKEGLTCQAIGDRYGVVRGTISKILLGQAWKHVPPMEAANDDVEKDEA